MIRRAVHARSLRPAARRCLSTTTVKSLLFSAAPPAEGDLCAVDGWVRSVRTQKHVAFVALGDGTTLRPLQVVLPPHQAAGLSNGAAVRVTGTWTRSIGAKQPFELHAQRVEPLGPNDAKAYPLQNKSHSPDFLRTIPHLRHRSPYGSLLLRLRSAVINAVTAYFHAHDWVQTHPPVITSSDCEGAGEVFSVTHDGGRPREHFFRAPKYLTVSAQLHLEALAQAVGKVWTLSPTFRAETSDSPRHLSEFYMLEAEMVFAADLNRVMDVVEGLLTAVGKDLLGNSQLREELALATENGDKTPTIVNVSRETLEKRWRRLAQGGYSRITHREAVALLDAAVKAGHVFDRAPAGALQAEHEKYLAQHFDGPVFVTDYPRDVKPFYMAASPGAGGTVSCFDLVVPDVCELAGGSLREHDPERLQAAMEARGLAEDELQWYMDLRRYGSVAHGGFGLGFDRLLCHLSGVNSLRDVVAFPRWHGRCDC